MTRASSAAEPSMEEILASIRRIISDGDEGSDREAENAMNQAAPAEPLATPREVASSDPGPAPVEHDEPGPAAAETSVEADDDEVFELTDEMLAEVPAEYAPTEAAHPERAQNAAPVPEADLAKARFAPPTDGLTRIEPKKPDVTFADSTLVDADTSFRRDNSAPPAAGGQGYARAVPPEAAPASAEQPAASSGNDTAGAHVGDDHLLSPPADAKVAAAFNQLASTILMKDARTLDDLVQDMLRPMLKEWLDDNLPQLVERLVREEIQRVSRGRG